LLKITLLKLNYQGQIY